MLQDIFITELAGILTQNANDKHLLIMTNKLGWRLQFGEGLTEDQQQHLCLQDSLSEMCQGVTEKKGSDGGAFIAVRAGGECLRCS